MFRMADAYGIGLDSVEEKTNPPEEIQNNLPSDTPTPNAYKTPKKTSIAMALGALVVVALVLGAF